MAWIQKNNYIFILLTLFFMIAIVIFITDHGDTTYEEIEIEHGDTLWTLAETYRGKMSHNDWIAKVKRENNLFNEKIVAGQQLFVPISQDVFNRTQNDSVKVAISDEQ